MLYYAYIYTFDWGFLHLKLHYYVYTFTFKTTMHKVIQNIQQVWDLKLTFNSRISRTDEFWLWFSSQMAMKEKYL